jgi:nanoRNase/pAp phosphatase (c-di-AMP/oligoRNAs hydrolase)
MSYILKIVSDDKTLALFNSIAVSDGNMQISLKNMDLTTKQYYSRMAGLLKARLVIRHKQSYSLTLLGKIFYYSQMKIGKALGCYWKLRAIESIEMSAFSGPNLKEQEMMSLVNALIDNHEIRDIVTKSIAVRFDNASKISPIALETK